MDYIVIVSPTNGHLIALADLMSRLPLALRDLTWAVLYVHGQGLTSFGNLPSLEERVDASTNGIILSSNDINRFAREVEDLYDFFMIGFEKAVPAVVDAVSPTADCLVALQLNDSSFWQCLFRNKPHATEFVSTIESARIVNKLPSKWKT